MKYIEENIDGHYRPEIDGLRAIAVLLVLLYHAGYEYFSGGFIGVDVFFVISGYLITRLLVLQISRGTFSFSRFYGRRVRRLVPALVATVVLTLLGASLVYSTTELVKLSLEVYPVLLGISNFRFSISADYFDIESVRFTFLNTWSLAVEWQYYIFAPLISFLFYRWFSLVGLLIIAFAAGLLSFVAYLVVHSSDPTVAFYWPFFRIWEFAIGGLLIFLPSSNWISKWVQEIISVISVFFIVICGILFSANDNASGYLLVIPCIFSAILIYCSNQGLVKYILSSRFFVSVGLISYSLYLVHWPVMVFFMRVRNSSEMLAHDRVPALILSFAVALFVYFAVERRFRAGPQNRLSLGRFSAVTAGAIGLVFLLSLSIFQNGGWPWRIVSQYANASEGYGDCRDVVACSLSREGDELVVLAGDSHAKHLTEGMVLVAPNFRAEVLTSPDCYVTDAFVPDAGRMESCQMLRSKVDETLSANPNATLLYSQRWRGYSDPEIVAHAVREFLEKNRNRKTIVIGQLAETKDSQYLCGATHDYIYNPQRCKAVLDRSTADQYNRQLSNIAAEFENVHFVDPQNALCPAGICRAVIGDQPLYIDGHHLSLFAARRIFTEQVIPLLGK